MANVPDTFTLVHILHNDSEGVPSTLIKVEVEKFLTFDVKNHR